MAGADFTRTDFYAEKCISRNEGIDLSGKNFDNTKFDLGDYKSASFGNSSLKNATFTGDDLTGADFKGADLTGADSGNASYNGPVKLHGADFTGAKIDGVLWTGANFDCNTKFPAGFRPRRAPDGDEGYDMQIPVAEKSRCRQIRQGISGPRIHERLQRRFPCGLHLRLSGVIS